MSCRFVRIAATTMLIALMPWVHREASAAGGYYSWGPFEAGGYYTPSPGGLPQFFTSDQGSLGLYYDPDNVYDCYLEAGSGISGVAGGAIVDRVSVGADSVTFYAADLSVTLSGDPGPLDPQGLPESIDSLTLMQASGDVIGGYPAAFDFGLGAFIGQTAAVPEPSGLVLGTIGLGLLVIGNRRRRHPVPGR